MTVFSIFLKVSLFVLSRLFNFEIRFCCIASSFFQDEIIKIKLSISKEISSEGNTFMMSKIETSFLLSSKFSIAL